MPWARHAPVTLVLALALLVPAAGAGAATPPTFQRITIAPRELVGEPRVFVDPSSRGAKYFVVGPGVGLNGRIDTFIWWSTDGRRFNGPLETQQGGGDSDIAIDPAHNVYSADLLDPIGNSTIPISIWDPVLHGFSYQGVVAPHATTLDRQWIAAPATNVVTATATDFNSGKLYSWVSTNNGRTFDRGHLISGGVSEVSPLVTGPSSGGVRSLYLAYLFESGNDPTGLHNVDEIRVAKSTDGGRHWSTSTAAHGQYTPLFPAITVDTRGGVYVAWTGSDPDYLGVDLSEWVIDYVSSRDGRSWSPITVASEAKDDPLGDKPVAIFPWLSGRTPGHVDLTYVIEKDVGVNSVLGPEFGGPQTKWDVRLAQSLDGLDRHPRFTHVVIAPNFHTGSMCEFGTACFGPQSQDLVNAPTPMDRRDLDFFGSAIDGSGRSLIAFCQDRSATTGNITDVLSSATSLRLGVQTGGQTVP
jgi:hypothetical protein